MTLNWLETGNINLTVHRQSQLGEFTLVLIQNQKNSWYSIDSSPVYWQHWNYYRHVQPSMISIVVEANSSIWDNFSVYRENRRGPAQSPVVHHNEYHIFDTWFPKLIKYCLPFTNQLSIKLLLLSTELVGLGLGFYCAPELSTSVHHLNSVPQHMEARALGRLTLSFCDCIFLVL